MDFAAQAEAIRQVTKRYWVIYIGVAVTRLGSGVAQLARKFFPAVTIFSYSPEVKTRLVLKGPLDCGACTLLHKNSQDYSNCHQDCHQLCVALT